MDTTTSQSQPGRSLGIASVPNLRDLGGYATRDGRLVRTRLVYRSNQLNPVPVEDLERIALLGLRCDFDLRTAQEADAFPDALPAGVERVWLDVLAGEPQADPTLLDRLVERAAEANAALGGGRIDAIVERVYRGFVSLPGSRQAYGRLFAAMAEPGRLPALFHCSAGKDRTGWGAAALLLLLEVPRETVVEDYMRSNDCVLPYYQPLIDRFVAGGGEPEIAAAIFGVKTEYLDAAFDEVNQQYGSIEAYFAGGLGIDAAAQAALRGLLIEPS